MCDDEFVSSSAETARSSGEFGAYKFSDSGASKGESQTEPQPQGGSRYTTVTLRKLPPYLLDLDSALGCVCMHNGWNMRRVADEIGCGGAYPLDMGDSFALNSSLPLDGRWAEEGVEAFLQEDYVNGGVRAAEGGGNGLGGGPGEAVDGASLAGYHAYPGVIFESLESGYIASVTLYQCARAGIPTLFRQG